MHLAPHKELDNESPTRLDQSGDPEGLWEMGGSWWGSGPGLKRLRVWEVRQGLGSYEAELGMVWGFELLERDRKWKKPEGWEGSKRGWGNVGGKR